MAQLRRPSLLGPTALSVQLNVSPPRRGQLSTAVMASVGRLVRYHMGGGVNVTR